MPALVTEGAKKEAIIKDYISGEFVRDAALLPLSHDTSLLDGGMLGSLSVLQLVVFPEERFGITVGETHLQPQNPASVRAICACVRAREAEQRPVRRG
jgi:acyl carrier protein